MLYCKFVFRKKRTYMLILTASNLVKLVSQKVFTPVAKLLLNFDLTLVAPDATTDIKTVFLAAIQYATINVQKRFKSGGTKELITNMPLKDALEIAANNEGFINCRLGGNGALIKATIELSNAGSIACDNDNFLEVTYNFGATGEVITVDVHSLGAPFTANAHLKYAPVSVLANVLQKFNTDGAYAIAIPSDTTKVIMKHLTGVDVELATAELEALSCDTNDIVYNNNSMVVPFGSWIVLPLVSCYEVQILNGNQSTVYLLKNKAYN